MEICKNCMHNEVCSFKENLEIAKSLVKVPEDYNENYPYVNIGFGCKHFKPGTFGLVSPVEKLI